MGALQMLVFVTSAVLLLENGRQLVEAAPSATYSITTLHRSSSSANSLEPSASKTPTAASPAGSYGRGDLGTTDYRRYLPVEDTPEVQKAREQFFRLYEKQARLAAEAPDNDLDGTGTKTYVMTKAGGDGYYYYDYTDEDYDDDDDEEDEVDSEEEGNEEDSEEEGDGLDDSSEDDEGDDDSSSSSEEGDDDDTSEEGEDSSSEESLEGDSSDSSSSSSEEDNGDARYSLNVQSLNANSLAAPRPVTDTPEVKQAKRNFFNLYKTQAELSFNAPDDK